MISEEKLKIPKLHVIKCPRCYVTILLPDNHSTKRAYNFIAKPHERLDCLQFGRMMGKILPYKVDEIKLYVQRNIKKRGNEENKKPIETHSNQEEFADMLLQLK